MVNKDKQVICDETGMILNDGVTIYPGYVHVEQDVLTRYDSNDPNNELMYNKPGILHHRVKYQFVAEAKPCDDPFLQGKHFMSMKALEKHLTGQDI